MMSNRLFTILVIIYMCLQQVRLDSSASSDTQIVNNNNNVNVSTVVTKVKVNQEKKPYPVADQLLTKVTINNNNNNSIVNSNHVNNVVAATISNSTTAVPLLQKKPSTTGVGVEKMQQANISLTTDTFIRGFYVFMGFGIIVLVYMGIKTIRVNQPPTPETTVRKYGIKAKRGDLEMLPLPLAEDEDDDTLFDVGNHVRTGN